MVTSITNIADGTAQAAAQPRAELAYQHLRKALLEGELTPGDKISVVAVTEQLACSRVPVMEAMKRLEADGFVEIIPQVGCHVSTPIATDVVDFFNLFATVESTVVGLAAERRRPSEIEEFKTLCANIDNKLKLAGGPEARDPIYRQLNLRFHSAIHAMARSPVSTKFASSLWDRSDFYIKLAFGSLYFSKAIKKSHREMRRAIIAGDANAAKLAAFTQLQTVGEKVTKALSKL
ncbi:MAG: GntR family transcriptional regulator [Pseudomonadota bacterium]